MSFGEGGSDILGPVETNTTLKLDSEGPGWERSNYFGPPETNGPIETGYMFDPGQRGIIVFGPPENGSPLH